MNPIKKKLADFLFEMSKNSMDALDHKSPCVKSLKNLDRDTLLKEDVQRICDEISILEAGKNMSLSTKLKLSNTGDADGYKNKMKSIAFEVVKRVEKKTGNLNLPPECRDLLMNL